MSARACRLAGFALVLAAAACGGPMLAPPPAIDAAPPAADAAPPACTASFTGNFTESSASFQDCAMLAPGSGDTVLAFAVPSTTLGSQVAIAIDLGASPSAGTYTSETVVAWSASGMVDIGGVACIYTAGSEAAPHGDFMLSLDALDPGHATAHGTLVVLQYVLTPPFTSCGVDPTETISLAY